MKTILLAAAAALSLVAATAAQAGEGYDEPFPFQAPGITLINPRAYAADTGSAAYPDLTGRASQVVTAGGPDEVPPTGSEGTVQTANSLPRGFEAGTVAYAQAQSVQRYFAAKAARQARAVQEAGQVPGGTPHG